MKQHVSSIAGAVMLLTAPAQAQFLGAEAARCGADHVVTVLKEFYEKEVVEELNTNPFTQVQGIQASITRMRESKRYERSIKKRFCRAEVSVRFIGVNDFLKFGRIPPGLAAWIEPSGDG